MRINAAVLAPRSWKPLISATGSVLVLAGIVQTTGAGIDLLALSLVCLILFVFERSVGDWVAEIAGPVGGAVIFAALGLGLSWYFLASTTGRSQADHFFLEAEKRGYKTLYYDVRPEAETEDVNANKTAPPQKPTPATNPSETEPAASPSGEAQNAVAAVAASDAAREAKGRVSEFARSFFPRDPNAPLAPTTIVLTVTPTKLEIPYRATLKAVVRAGDAPVGFGNVDFTANGLGAGRVRLSADGTATTTFVPRLAGSYEFRARFTGSTEHAASISTPIVAQAFIKK